MLRRPTCWLERWTSWMPPLWRLSACNKPSCWGLWPRSPCLPGRINGTYCVKHVRCGSDGFDSHLIFPCSTDFSLCCWDLKGKWNPTVKLEEPSPRWCQMRYVVTLLVGGDYPNLARNVSIKCGVLFLWVLWGSVSFVQLVEALLQHKISHLPWDVISQNRPWSKWTWDGSFGVRYLMYHLNFSTKCQEFFHSEEWICKRKCLFNAAWYHDLHLLLGLLYYYCIISLFIVLCLSNHLQHLFSCQISQLSGYCCINRRSS